MWGGNGGGAIIFLFCAAAARLKRDDKALVVVVVVVVVVEEEPISILAVRGVDNDDDIEAISKFKGIRADKVLVFEGTEATDEVRSCL